MPAPENREKGRDGVVASTAVEPNTLSSATSAFTARFSMCEMSFQILNITNATTTALLDAGYSVRMKLE